MKEYIIAFSSGIVSFASPCILPLIPGYLSIISGFSARDILSDDGKLISSKKLLYFSLAFVLGFSTVFTLLGAFSATAGGFFYKNRLMIERVMGVLMFLIGLHISGFIKINFLNYEKRKIHKSKASSYLSSFITGVSFAFGWSPCIGPFLASILMIASTQSVSKGGMLLFVYSLGLGIPFIVASLLSGAFFKFISNNKKFFLYLEKIAGVLIMLIGVLIFFDRFSLD